MTISSKFRTALTITGLVIAIASIGFATIFFWIEMTNVHKKFRTAHCITGLFTVIAIEMANVHKKFRTALGITGLVIDCHLPLRA